MDHKSEIKKFILAMDSNDYLTANVVLEKLAKDKLKKRYNHAMREIKNLHEKNK